MEKLNNLTLKAYCAAVAAMGDLKERAKKVMTEERGAADFIAVILIIAIVVALCVVFRKQIVDIFDKIWDNVTGDVDKANAGYDGKYPATATATA